MLKSLKDLEKKLTNIGITPLELYMRQNGMCWLEMIDGVLHCTDGKDTALTEQLANPTHECSQCFCRYIKGLQDEAGK